MPLTCPHVPELDRAIIAAGDHKLVIELQTRDSRLVFVGTWEINNRNSLLTSFEAFLPERV